MTVSASSGDVVIVFDGKFVVSIDFFVNNLGEFDIVFFLDLGICVVLVTIVIPLCVTLSLSVLLVDDEESFC